MSIAQDALPLWGLQGAAVTLIAARENAVYRIDTNTGPLAMRLHRTGYRTDAELRAELDWMAVLAQAGMSVPSPIASRDGAYLQTVNGAQVDVLTWLSGDTLDTALPTMRAAKRAATFHRLGQDMARLHLASDAWEGAASCRRPAWDPAGLLGDAPLWDRFWDNPGLNEHERDTLVSFRTRAMSDLSEMAASLDYGLIHADLVPANVMVDGDAIHLIDFDDGGFGYRVFDIATALLKLCHLPDFDKLQAALLGGYRSERAIETDVLDLFMALRAMTYLGWNIRRQDEDQTGARNARFIAQATELATEYLKA